jgi:hypothetical protein
MMTMEAFLGVLVGLSGLAGTIVYAYFDRKDREQKNKEV